MLRIIQSSRSDDSQVKIAVLHGILMISKTMFSSALERMEHSHGFKTYNYKVTNLLITFREKVAPLTELEEVRSSTAL